MWIFLLGFAAAATMALACGAPAPDEGTGEVLEWILRRGLAIGSADDPAYGLWAVGGVLADEDRVPRGTGRHDPDLHS